MKQLLYWLAGAMMSLASIECVLQMLPVPTATKSGYYIDPLILTYPADHRWRSATGWDLRNSHWNRSNNHGFVTHRDFARDPNAIALIGDSFVEASMLDPNDRPGAQLERALASRPVYAMGGPGSAILDYAERIRFAAETYGIRDFVVLLERTDVRQSLCGSGNIHGPCIDKTTLALRRELQVAAGGLRKILRNSAFAQYFSGQLRISSSKILSKIWSEASVHQGGHAITDGIGEGSAQSNDSTPSAQAQAAVLEAFFQRVRPYVSGRLVLVIDSNRSELYAGRSSLDTERIRLIESARQRGYSVIDSEPVFRRHIAESPLSLDVGPYDRHLNRIGISLLIGEILAELAKG